MLCECCLFVMLINRHQMFPVKLSFMENFGMAIPTPCLLTFDFILTVKTLYVVAMKCQFQGEFWHWDTWHDWSSNTLCQWHFIPAMDCNDSFLMQGRFTLSTGSVIPCAKFILDLNPLTWLELHVREVWLWTLSAKTEKCFHWQPGRKILVNLAWLGSF